VDAGHFFGLQIELPPETVTMALRADEQSAASMQMPVVPCYTRERLSQMMATFVV
jgi:hypothetical protein